MSHFSVFHWSSLKQKKTDVLNVYRHVAPSEKHPGSLIEGFTQTQVSTIAVKDNLLVVGGFKGELICKYLDRPGVSFCSRTTYDENAITNALDIYTTPSGAVHLAASNNDCGVREFDMERFQMTKHFRFPWPVNHTSISPDGKLLVVVGDNPEGMLVDSRSGKVKSSSLPHLPQHKELFTALSPYHSQLVGESYLGKRRQVYDCSEVQVGGGNDEYSDADNDGIREDWSTFVASFIYP